YCGYTEDELEAEGQVCKDAETGEEACDKCFPGKFATDFVADSFAAEDGVFTAADGFVEALLNSGLSFGKGSGFIFELCADEELILTGYLLDAPVAVLALDILCVEVGVVDANFRQ